MPDVTLTENPTRLVGCHLPADQSGWGPSDVHGLLLGEFADGWCIVGEHISSGPGWAQSDIGRKAATFEGCDYKWIGEQTNATLTADYPPAPRPEGDDDAAVRDA